MTDSTEQLKNCPFCAELVKEAAKKCKHCGETLDVVLRVAEEAKRNQNNTNQNVIVNNTLSGNNKKRFPHALHLLACLFTGLIWTPIYILHYIFRDTNTYN